MTTTETTSTSWFSRLGASFKNIFIGFLLVIGAIILLFWNEGRTVKTEQNLKEGFSVVVSVSPDKKDLKNEGKLIHFSGMTKSPDLLTDSEFEISANALKMQRVVEVYQWKEESKSKTVQKLGGGTETTTTYTYSKEWSDKLIDSSNFREAETHQNPSAKLFLDQEWISNEVTVGEYAISEDLLSALSGYQSFTIPQEMFDAKNTTSSAQLQLAGNTIYYQTNNITTPEIGSTRISYEIIPPQDISVIYKQSGENLVPYQTKNGSKISMIQLGKSTAEEMFKNAQESNKMMTWILRFVGAFLLFIGFQMILGVLPVVGSVIPFIGNIIGAGVGLVSFLLTIIIGTVVIAIAWITYRPFIAVILFAVAVAGFVMLRNNSKKS
ncbi:MAG: TMEM43 family protein [Patescibacteria group bacterium]|mgnify:FL=1